MCSTYYVTIFSNGSKFWPVSNFRVLHALAQAAHSYVLLLKVSIVYLTYNINRTPGHMLLEHSEIQRPRTTTQFILDQRRSKSIWLNSYHFWVLLPIPYTRFLPKKHLSAVSIFWVYGFNYQVACGWAAHYPLPANMLGKPMVHATAISKSGHVMVWKAIMTEAAGLKRSGCWCETVFVYSI